MVILKVFYIIYLIISLWLTHLLFWLQSKERGWRFFCKYVGGIAIKSKACSRSQYSRVNICTNLLWPVSLMCTTGRIVCLAWCGHKKSRLDELDACLRKRKLVYCKKNKLCKFNIYCRKDEPGRLPKLNLYYSCKDCLSVQCHLCESITNN